MIRRFQCHSSRVNLNFVCKKDLLAAAIAALVPRHALALMLRLATYFGFIRTFGDTCWRAMEGVRER